MLSAGTVHHGSRDKFMSADNAVCSFMNRPTALFSPKHAQIIFFFFSSSLFYCIRPRCKIINRIVH